MSIQLQNFVSLTTTGTSGASTLTNGVLNVPNYATSGGTWVDYSSTSTIVGWSSFTTKWIFYSVIGKQILVSFRISGTSDSTSATFTLPFNGSANFIAYSLNVSVTNNGVASNTPGRVSSNSSSNVITILRDNTSTAFTATGSKAVLGQIFFEIE